MKIKEITLDGTQGKWEAFMEHKKVSLEVAKFYLRGAEGLYWKASVQFNKDRDSGKLNGLFN